MEDDNQISTISKPTIPIAIALVGAVVGVVALFVSINSSSRASDSEDNLLAMQDSVNKAAALQVELKDMSSKIENLARELEEIRSASITNINVLSKNTKDALTAINSEVAKNRELIANVQKLSTSASKPKATTSTTKVEKTVATTSAGGKTHRVRPGDSLSKIARTYGKKLSEIEKANPGVDSRRLNIGQEIVIP